VVALTTPPRRPTWSSFPLVAPGHADRSIPHHVNRFVATDRTHRSSEESGESRKQARFDTFVTRYNQERPHQALGMKVPRDVYARSARLYRGLEEVSYPFADATFTVTHCGRICFHGRKINLSHVFAGQNVGVTQVGDRIWLVTFMHYDLGYFDDEAGRVEPIDNPFGPKVLPMCSE
jgi:putative transposase